MGVFTGGPLKAAEVGHWIYETVKKEDIAQAVAAADSALKLMDSVGVTLELDAFLDVAWRELSALVDQHAENSTAFNELARMYATLLDAEGVTEDAALAGFTQLCGAASAAVEPHMEFVLRYSQHVHGSVGVDG